MSPYNQACSIVNSTKEPKRTFRPPSRPRLSKIRRSDEPAEGRERRREEVEPSLPVLFKRFLVGPDVRAVALEQVPIPRESVRGYSTL